MKKPSKLVSASPERFERGSVVNNALSNLRHCANVPMSNSSTCVPNCVVKANDEIDSVAFELGVHHVLKVEQGALL